MKKTFLTTLYVLLCTICFGQSYTIKSDGVEFVVADYAKEIIEKNISVKSGYNYEFELLQDGDSFAVSYIVNPGNLTGRESTDDLWNEIEQTIMRALNAMNKQINNVIQVQKQTAKQKEETETIAKQEIVKEEPENVTTSDEEKPKDNFFKKQYEIKTGIENKYQNNQIDRTNQSVFLNGMKVYSLNEVREGMASIGSLMQFPDGSIGVIYYFDAQGHGLAVSLEQTRLKWENVDDEEYCKDITSLNNMTRFDRQCVIGLGAEETFKIIEFQGYPAAKWCVNRGSGWYLPSVGELYQLLVVANGENGEEGFISIILKACGGIPLNGSWYWSSTEENSENAYNISSSGRIATEIKCEKVYTRAVRQF